MFTGIIHCVARVVERRQEGDNISFRFQSSLSHRLQVNQSVAHNGTCLSIVDHQSDTHSVVAVHQSLRTTNLCNLKEDAPINIELALVGGQRIDGHYVQGHVDGCLECLDIQARAGSWVFVFELPKDARHLLVEKGSICLNGVSLTVHDLRDDHFSVSIIPYTYAQTNFSSLKVGDHVNVEFDILGKYIERLFERSQKT